jgi:hypothetical protein
MHGAQQRVWITRGRHDALSPLCDDRSHRSTSRRARPTA